MCYVNLVFLAKKNKNIEGCANNKKKIIAALNMVFRDFVGLIFLYSHIYIMEFVFFLFINIFYKRVALDCQCFLFV